LKFYLIFAKLYPLEIHLKNQSKVFIPQTTKLLAQPKQTNDKGR